MKNQRLVRCFAVAVVTVLSAAGCHRGASQATKLHGERFAPDDEPRAVQNFAAAQAAAGARSDGTLHAVHFDAQGLNSLGREKIDLMMRGEEPAQPLVVYLDVARGPVTAEAARQSVTDYLKGRGLPENQIKLVDGPNTGSLHPAAEAGAALKTLGQAPAATSAGGDKQVGYTPATPDVQPANR